MYMCCVVCMRHAPYVREREQVFVMPSESETLGFVVLEAMASR